MAISLCQIYNDNKGALNTWVKGHYRPQNFAFDLYMATMEIFNECRRDWENNQIVTDKNRVFFRNRQYTIKDLPQGGIMLYPSDYVSFSSLRFFSPTKDGAGVKCKGFEMAEDCKELTEEEKVDAMNENELVERTITKVDNQRWGAVLEDLIVGPSLENPYSTQLEGGFKVVPREIGYAILNYLAAPKRPVFKYSRDANDNLICSPGSTVFEYGPEVLPDIMSRIKTKYSSFVGDQQKYSEGVKETANAV